MREATCSVDPVFMLFAAYVVASCVLGNAVAFSMSRHIQNPTYIVMMLCFLYFRNCFFVTSFSILQMSRCYRFLNILVKWICMTLI